MFFADLTPYTYASFPERPQPNVLNIGWLSREYPFATGGVPGSFVRILRRLIASPVFIPSITAMGFHGCELCPPVEEPPGVWALGSPAPPGSLPAMGNGELWVPTTGSLVYVAPVLVAHYIEAHDYLPPQEFIDAVVTLQAALGA